MKIQQIQTTKMLLRPRNIVDKEKPKYTGKNESIFCSNSNSPHYILAKKTNRPYTIIFKGELVHIVDGGIHADNMRHFLRSIRNNIDIKMHDVLINRHDRNTKQLKSVEEQLKNLNERHANYGFEYIAVPVLASVPLLNLQDQYQRIMGEFEEFTPENIKSKKEKLLNFLKEIYMHPKLYSEQIGYMDGIGQGIEYTYGIIQEINKLVKKCAFIYVPSGHPTDATLKWLAGERGLKPELYHYISTGEDIDNKIKNIQKELADKNWYTFNLLSLSDAKIVGVKNTDWKQDYIFAAYDSCVTDSARGVYNLSPIRKENDIIGYSFSEKYTNDYPYKEFPLNKEVANLLPFVGKNKKEVLATKEETELFLKNKKNPKLQNKLFKIEDVFSKLEIERNKLNIQGKYVDSSLKLFFDENSDEIIIFRKCDCEKSGRPSVLPIWGSCYAVMNAISRDIGIHEKSGSLYDIYSSHLRSALNDINRKNFGVAEYCLSEANKIAKVFSQRSPVYKDLYRAAEELGKLYLANGNYDDALGCLNFAIDTLALNFTKHTKSKNIETVKLNYNNYLSYKSITKNYDKAIKEYNNLPAIIRLFASKPTYPTNYGQEKTYQYAENEYKFYVLKFADLYRSIAGICRMKKENYAAMVCDAAVKDILNCNQRGNQIISRRAEKIQYIGDLYNEIKPN